VKIEAVVFDLDGTLIDSVMAHVISWLESFKQHGFHKISLEDIEKLIGLPGLTIVKILLGEKGLRMYKSIRRLKDSIFLNLVLKGEVKLYTHTTEVLEVIKDMGLKVCLATSTPSYLLNVILPRLGINELFDVIIPGDYVRKGKPDPEIFLKAFNHLKIPPHKGIIVGDSIYDIIPAKKINSIAVLVLHGRKILLSDLEVKPDYIIDELMELIPIVKELLI